MATQACDTCRLIQSTTRDITDNANANTRAILYFLTQDKISTLQAENQSLKLAASQAAQNAYLIANNDAQTAELIRRIAPSPMLSYMLLMRGNRREDNSRHDYRHPYDAPGDAFLDRRSRRHYDNGRYAPMRSTYDDMMSYDYGRRYTHDLPQNRRYLMGWDLQREMKRIIMNHIHRLCTANTKGRDTIRRSGDRYQIGGSVRQKDENRDKKLDHKTAEKWVSQISKPGKPEEKAENGPMIKKNPFSKKGLEC